MISHLVYYAGICSSVVGGTGKSSKSISFAGCQGFGRSQIHKQNIINIL